MICSKYRRGETDISGLFHLWHDRIMSFMIYCWTFLTSYTPTDLGGSIYPLTQIKIQSSFSCYSKSEVCMWTNTVMKNHNSGCFPLEVRTPLQLRGLHSATSVTPNRVYYVVGWKWFSFKVTAIQWRGVNWSSRSAHLNGAFQYITVFFLPTQQSRQISHGTHPRAHTDTGKWTQTHTQMCTWT